MRWNQCTRGIKYYSLLFLRHGDGRLFYRVHPSGPGSLSSVSIPPYDELCKLEGQVVWAQGTPAPPLPDGALAYSILDSERWEVLQ